MADTRPTEYLPLTSTFSAPVACSSEYVIPGLNGFMYAFDPGQKIKDPGAGDCHAEQVISWWVQDREASTSTALGGTTFVCPNLYNQVASITDTPNSRALIACCPSSYTFVSVVSAPFPAQCRSVLKPGTITFLSRGPDSLFSRSTSLLETSSPIFGVQVNGYITQGTSTSTSSGSSTTTGSFATSTGSISANPTPSQTAPSESSGLSTGTKAGIGGGVGGLALLAILGAFLWYRRRHHYKAVELAAGDTISPAEGYYQTEAKPAQELNATKYDVTGHCAPHQVAPHELSSRPHGPTELS